MTDMSPISPFTNPGLLAPPNPLQAPPSPSTHRALRRLQSAHTLGSSFTRQGNQISLISQQRLSSSQLVVSHTRNRSNSDASMVPPLQSTQSSARRQAHRRHTAGDALTLDRLIREGPPNGDVAGALESTRLKILDSGIKTDGDGMSNLRIYVWLILLNAPVLETDRYLNLVHRGASPAYSKIRNDTFRTLTTDPLFRRRVTEASLIRLLNAIAWTLHDAQELAQKDGSNSSDTVDDPDRERKLALNRLHRRQVSHPRQISRSRALTITTESSDNHNNGPGVYVQGMNVLAAPFLYAARSEAEAYIAFHTLLTKECPGYIRGSMDGVHKGLALVDKVLAIVDPKLNLYLMGKGMHAEIYAFPSVLTLCACTPPLPEVLRLWDFLFAYGPHLNLLCIVAQLVMLRNEILSSPSPTKILRNFPPLQAETIKEVTLTLLRKIPDDLYEQIIMHAK